MATASCRAEGEREEGVGDGRKRRRQLGRERREAAAVAGEGEKGGAAAEKSEKGLTRDPRVAHPRAARGRRARRRPALPHLLLRAAARAAAGKAARPQGRQRRGSSHLALAEAGRTSGGGGGGSFLVQIWRGAWRWRLETGEVDTGAGRRGDRWQAAVASRWEGDGSGGSLAPWARRRRRRPSTAAWWSCRRRMLRRRGSVTVWRAGGSLAASALASISGGTVVTVTTGGYGGADRRLAPPWLVATAWLVAGLRRPGWIWPSMAGSVASTPDSQGSLSAGRLRVAAMCGCGVGGVAAMCACGVSGTTACAGVKQEWGLMSVVVTSSLSSECFSLFSVPPFFGRTLFWSWGTLGEGGGSGLL
ncbi:hypothetical protein OsI_28897 [Oryza sativa Indica Group]|uniref:Uncharacterized protein n=1 Tax=Oryza sativa subsp. indica TaxID=39946 RepID=B8BA24_ORYSI|nr:hypothetical protein OsI_28897 [Oryza sativa Indica Group]